MGFIATLTGLESGTVANILSNGNDLNIYNQNYLNEPFSIDISPEEDNEETECVYNCWPAREC